MNRYALSIIHFQNSIVFQVCTLFYETVVEISVNVTLISLGNYVYECGSIKCCNGIFKHSILLSKQKCNVTVWRIDANNIYNIIWISLQKLLIKIIQLRSIVFYYWDTLELFTITTFSLSLVYTLKLWIFPS